MFDSVNYVAVAGSEQISNRHKAQTVKNLIFVTSPSSAKYQVNRLMRFFTIQLCQRQTNERTDGCTIGR